MDQSKPILMVPRFVIQGELDRALDNFGINDDANSDEAAQEAFRNFRRSIAIFYVSWAR